MSKITPINEKGMTPGFVVQELVRDVSEIKEIFVITFSKENGTGIYISGDAKSGAFAAAILQDFILHGPRN